MKSCFIFSNEKDTNCIKSQSSPQLTTLSNSETMLSLPFLIESLLFDSPQSILISNNICDYNIWVKIPQVIAHKKRNSFENISLFKNVLTKSKIFKSEFSSQLYQSISMGKGQMCCQDFKKFYDELDQIINNQRIFYYFNKCNEFLLCKEHFESNLNHFIKFFKKILKSTNLIVDYLIRKNQKIEDLKKDYLYLDYLKMVSDFRTSLNRNSVSAFFENQEPKIEKKKFLNNLNNCKTFPLVYLFEFLRLEKLAINLSLNSNTLSSSEIKPKATKIKKFLMNEIKKTLKRCELNGDPSCNCSFCKW